MMVHDMELWSYPSSLNLFSLLMFPYALFFRFRFCSFLHADFPPCLVSVCVYSQYWIPMLNICMMIFEPVVVKWANKFIKYLFVGIMREFWQENIIFENERSQKLCPYVEDSFGNDFVQAVLYDSLTKFLAVWTTDNPLYRSNLECKKQDKMMLGTVWLCPLY